MMKNILEYKGYHTRIEFDSEELVLRGKIEGINDFVDFESDDIKGIEKEFHSAVDDYLDFCKEVGKEPEKEYKGTFNVRIGSDLHKKLAMIAMEKGESLNATVEKAIRGYILDNSTERQSSQKTTPGIVHA
ncbi:MAG: type II toxin-antitoxin system HicB family antitoxin [Lachnospiraceae bacterium]|nr:type II toxin-antitoxin system HicB family antitoxin [Lachnospiraceae bacterium]